jgi:hypothetical protein
MTRHSTARFISYDVRPAKQVERLILIDILRVGADCGLPITQYRYVGMGANRFYDFLLVHKYIGINEMVSLEHDPVMFKRAKFNAPYKFIDVQPMSAADFISDDSWTRPTISWLDYDGGVSGGMVRDIIALSSGVKLGDFLFVTAFGGPPEVTDGMNDEERHAWVQDNIGETAGNVERSDVEKANFPKAVFKILSAAFRNAFATRTDGDFVPMLQVVYSDSTPMVTVGGAFLNRAQSNGVLAQLQVKLPFLKFREAELYKIRSLHLTERERALFDRAVTSSSGRSTERNQLKQLGFKDVELAAYRELLRYVPRYVESII